MATQHRTATRVGFLVTIGVIGAATAAWTGQAREQISPLALRFEPLAADRPLGGHAAIRDAAGQRIVLHGGERDGFQPPPSMRQLDVSTAGGAWSDFRPSGAAPTARLEGRGLPGSPAAVDPEDRTALVVCDCINGSTHLLDLAQQRWSRAPGDRSLPLWYPLLTYDPANDRMVLYGGDEQGDAVISVHGWSYDMSPSRRGWRALPDAPFRLLYQAFDYDPASGHLVVYGGQDDRGGAVSELWRLDVGGADDDGAWVELTPGGAEAPVARYGATLTFVGDTGLAVLYGGWSPSGDFDDVWLLDYTDPSHPVWYLESATSPAGLRSGHSATWDEQNDRIVVYGGVRGVEFLSDAWAIVPVVPTATPTGATEPASPSPTGTPTATSSPTPTPSASTTSTPGGQNVSVYLPDCRRP